jgi:hypothetical protein
MRIARPPLLVAFLFLAGTLLPGPGPGAAAGELDELKVKREAVFEFAEKPRATRAGDNVTVRFETRGFCDVTVAVENRDGRIIRHLASGVLGPKAPPPLQRNSKKQTLLWNGKDDQDVYVDDQAACTIRVSLGLKPQFERTMFWSPHKRVGPGFPALRAAPEGVYVAEGHAVDQVRLFDHSGNYLRTVYPFPAEKIDKVLGLKMQTFAQDGRSLPLKRGYHQATLLTSGSNSKGGNWITDSAEGYAVNAMAANGGQLALVHLKLNRLAADGSSGGLPLEGPGTGIAVGAGACGWGHEAFTAAPLSAALSPDSKWLYLAGYCFDHGWSKGLEWLNGVWRMPYAENAEPALFAGDAKPGIKNGGAEDGKFRGATSVACDPKGRVYVSDYMNDRVQVFDPDGKLLKSIPAAKPARVAVHHKTGDIYVFSWMLFNRSFPNDQITVEPTMTHLGPFENPAVKSRCPLPLVACQPRPSTLDGTGGHQQRAELDSWAEPPAVWIVNGRTRGGELDGFVHNYWDLGNVQVLEELDGKLVAKRKFMDDVRKSVVRNAPPILWRQRLYVNPATGRLYVAEGDSGVMKSVNQLVELDPATGKVKLVDLPLGGEDFCFDNNGLIYIRTDTAVARYEPGTWREVPWDYGEELKGHSYGMGAKGADLISALVTPGHRSFNFWQLGGIDISLKGHLVVTTCNGQPPKDLRVEAREAMGFEYRPSKYTPQVYPGRMRWGEIHVWDKHGKLVAEDAVPGMGHLNGIGIDQDDNIYMLAASRRIVDGQPVDPGVERDASGTLLKVPARKAKVLSSGTDAGVPVPLPAGDRPKRSPDLAGYTSGWVEGAEWFYGGIGFSVPGGCVCWNCRFAKDYFNRSFAPETLHCSVAVLDSAGNLILRIGKYGNVDDGRPLFAEGGPPSPRAIGGDEVSLMYAGYVGTHTDRRLFIADAGNGRILSVKLGYAAEERIAVQGAAGEGGK